MESIAERRRLALPLGSIPAEFHYVGHRQSELWLAVARCHAPTGLDIFYRGAFAALPIPHLPHLVGLGPGSAQKEAWLQEKLQARRFTPVDVSESLSLFSALRLRPHVAHAPRPLVADLTRFPNLPDWLSEFDGGEPRLFSAFGVTPNLPPGELDPALRAFLRPEDWLLISANLIPGGDANSILPQYDNSETRAWLRELLLQWGIAPHLGEIDFDVQETAPGEACISAQATWKQNVCFPWAGSLFQPSPGTPLLLFRSLRYSPEAFGARLRRAGFDEAGVSISQGVEEGLWLARKRPASQLGNAGLLNTFNK